MSMWKKPPPVCMLSGAEDYLVRNEIAKAIQGAEATGRIVERISGTDKEGLVDLMSTTGVLFDEKYLVIVDDPEKMDVQVVQDHYERGDSSLALVIHVDGEIKAKSAPGKIAKFLPQNLVAKFSSPKPWERDAWAAKYVLDWVRDKGFSIDISIANGIVTTAGTDLGILSFEVEKIALLAESEGVKEVTPDLVRRTLTSFSEASVLPVVDALGEKQLNRLSSALYRVRQTTGGPKSGAVLKTMALVNFNVVKWLEVKALLDQGENPSGVAIQTGLNEYVLKKNILPVVRKWDQGSLVSLLSGLSRIERGIRSGWVDSWSVFEATLFEAVR